MLLKIVTSEKCSLIFWLCPTFMNSMFTVWKLIPTKWTGLVMRIIRIRVRRSDITVVCGRTTNPDRFMHMERCFMSFACRKTRERLSAEVARELLAYRWNWFTQYPMDCVRTDPMVRRLRGSRVWVCNISYLKWVNFLCLFWSTLKRTKSERRFLQIVWTLRGPFSSSFSSTIRGITMCWTKRWCSLNGMKWEVWVVGYGTVYTKLGGHRYSVRTVIVPNMIVSSVFHYV